MLASGMLQAILIGGLVAATSGALAQHQPEAQVQSPNVEATLMAEHLAVRPGLPLRAGVRLKMNPGWHTYWTNPGDSGLATKIEWALPEGWKAGPTQWPLPTLFGDGTVKSYGYADEVLLISTLTPPPGTPKGDARISAKVSWLECADICKPGKGTLSLTIAFGNGGAAAASAGPAVDADGTPAGQLSADAPLFAATRKLWPTPAPAAAVSFEEVGGAIVVSWPATWAADTAQFFPESAGITEPSAEQVRVVEGKRARLTIARPEGAAAVPKDAAGVLVLTSAKPANPAAAPASSSSPSKKAYRITWRSK
jgi:DsbC/DsbD-like thiol-disulfide interchange protein